MFSSDDGSFDQETLEGGVHIELPSDSPPEKTKRSKAKSLARTPGRPRILSFAERVEAWHEYVIGASIFDLAAKYETQPDQVQEGLNLVAQELGYPHNHIDPELERFLVLESSSRMKSAQAKLLVDNDRILKDLVFQRSVVKSQLDEILIDSRTSVDEFKFHSNLSKIQSELEIRYQSAVKTQISIMAEYRATNLVIADLTGIKRTKPVRKPKTVPTPEETLEVLSNEQLFELAQAE